VGVVDGINNMSYDEEEQYEREAPPLKVDLSFTVGDLDSVVYSIVHQVSKTLTEQMSSEMKKEVTALVKGKLTMEANTLVEGVINSKVRPCDRFGDPTGEPISLKEMFEKQVNNYLSENVGSDGKPAKYGDKGRPRVEWYIQSVITDELNSFLTGLKKQMKEEISETYNKQLQIRVSSLIKEFVQPAP
jgi:hypothetical protein